MFVKKRSKRIKTRDIDYYIDKMYEDGRMSCLEYVSRDVVKKTIIHEITDMQERMLCGEKIELNNLGTFFIEKRRESWYYNRLGMLLYFNKHNGYYYYLRFIPYSNEPNYKKNYALIMNKDFFYSMIKNLRKGKDYRINDYQKKHE